MSRALVVFALFLAFLLLLKPTAAASRAPGWMGIVGADLTPDQCRSFGVTRGVQVVEVEPGGPADRKDIEEGDLIVRYEDQPVRSAACCARARSGCAHRACHGTREARLSMPRGMLNENRARSRNDLRGFSSGGRLQTSVRGGPAKQGA